MTTSKGSRLQRPAAQKASTAITESFGKAPRSRAAESGAVTSTGEQPMPIEAQEVLRQEPPEASEAKRLMTHSLPGPSDPIWQFLHELGEQVDSISSRLDSRLDALESRLDKLEIANRGTNKSVEALWAALPPGDIVARVAHLRDEVEAIKAGEISQALGATIKQFLLRAERPEPIVGATTIAVTAEPEQVLQPHGSADVQQAPRTDPQPGSSGEPGRQDQGHNGSGNPPGDDPDKPEKAPSKKDKSKKDKRKKRKARKGNGDSDPSSDSSSESSSSDDSESDDGSVTSDGSSDSDSDYATRDDRGGIFARKRRPAYKTLKELKPIDRDYKTLLSYRHYRLRNRSQKAKPEQANRKVRELIKLRETVRRGERFDGQDGITVLTFLERLVEDVELCSMSEAQAFMAMDACLSGQAKVLFKAASGILPGGSGLRSWSEAIQYLLLTYATDTAIEEALSALKASRQRPNEDERAYSARFTQAEQRCGNVHRWRERKLLYIDGLQSAVKPLVARFNKLNRKGTFNEIVECAYDEGNAHRARLGIRRNTDVLVQPAQAKKAQPSKPLKSKTQRVNLVEETPEHYSWDSPEGSQSPQGSGELHLLQAESVDTDDLPSTSIETIDATAETDPVMLAKEAYRRVRPPGIPGGDRQTRANRPGWVDRSRFHRPQPDRVRRPSVGQSPMGRDVNVQPAYVPSGSEYCYTCYFPGHISPDCRLDIAKFAELVVRNFENLPQGVSVPPTSYFKAKSLLEATPQAPRLQHPPMQQPDPASRAGELYPQGSQRTPPGSPRQGEANRGQAQA